MGLRVTIPPAQIVLRFGPSVGMALHTGMQMVVSKVAVLHNGPVGLFSELPIAIQIAGPNRTGGNERSFTQ